MRRWKPCKRRVFVKRLRALGFEGPYAGTRHQFLVHEHHRLAIANNSEYSVPQLRMMLREAEIILGREVLLAEWVRL